MDKKKKKKKAAPGVVGRLVLRVQRVANDLRRRQSALYYRVRNTDRGFAFLRAVEFAWAPRQIAHRRRVAREYNATTGHPVMGQASGWGAITPATFDGLDQALAICQALFEEKYEALERGPARRTGEAKATMIKRQFLRNILTDDDLRRYPALVDFALSDKALGIATSYLGTVPYLNRIDMLYSIPREGDDLIRSQLFHVDPEGLTQVKFFINVFDVGDAEGPFTFIPADESTRILAGIRELRQRQGQPHYGRYTDEEVAAVGGTGAIVSLKGPRGSGVAIDTSRCLHLGSRVHPGSFRLVLYVQYCTTRENGNAFDIARYRDRPVPYLAIRHSVNATGGMLKAPDRAAG